MIGPGTARSTPTSIRVLLDGILDYAGLFPPASLNMNHSVSNYAHYLRHPLRWALGRFVLTVARLDDFLLGQADSARMDAASTPWRLSAIISEEISSGLAAADIFNRAAQGAVIESIELFVSEQGDVERVRGYRPPGAAVFFEIAPEQAEELLPAIRRAGGYAKLRTGGVVPEAIPSVEAVAGFLAQCAEVGVPFKVTAGLHHALRASYPLTYRTDSPRAAMHGFLNVFTAAAIAWNAHESGKPAPLSKLAACLADTESAHWHFGEDALTWSGDRYPVRIGVDTLAAMRSKFGLCFGSCSFEEPLDELRGLELI